MSSDCSEFESRASRPELRAHRSAASSANAKIAIFADFQSDDDYLSLEIEFLPPSDLLYVAVLKAEGSRPPSEFSVTKMVNWRESLSKDKEFMDTFSEHLEKRGDLGLAVAEKAGVERKVWYLRITVTETCDVSASRQMLNTF